MDSKSKTSARRHKCWYFFFKKKRSENSDTVADNNLPLLKFDSGQTLCSEKEDAIVTNWRNLQMNSVSCSSTSTSHSSKGQLGQKKQFLGDRGPKDYIFFKSIGEGSYSTVYLAKDIHTDMIHAIKVCEKSVIKRAEKMKQTIQEKEILSLLNSKPKNTAPFFVKQFCFFQDQARLYFVLSYAKNGDLFSHLKKAGKFNIPCTKFYSAEILHAVEHLHALGIIHRDLKPENILLDENMHIQIADFGSAKILRKDGERTYPDLFMKQRRNSFVGTTDYVSPEILTDSTECSRGSDLWTFGVIVYQMLTGSLPFRSNTPYLTFKKVKSALYEFPDKFCPFAKDLVQKLLVIDPSKRLGALDGDTYTSIRSHPFYWGIEFETLYRQTPPLIDPYLPGTSVHGQLHIQYRIPGNFEPGLNGRQIARLWVSTNVEGTSFQKTPYLGLTSLTPEKIEEKLWKQKITASQWHSLCDGNLILKQGLVKKKKGLLARKRMLILTFGPHLYYADPVRMVIKGEIPWSPELRAEPKNFKVFFVHTKEKTYYLEDPDGYALKWCEAIEEMRVHTYG